MSTINALLSSSSSAEIPASSAHLNSFTRGFTSPKRFFPDYSCSTASGKFSPDSGGNQSRSGITPGPSGIDASSGSMELFGFPSRQCGNQYCHRGSEAEVSHGSAVVPQGFSTPVSFHKRQPDSSIDSFCRRLVKEGHSDKDRDSPSRVFQQNVSCAKETRQDSSNYRPISVEYLHCHSISKNGAFRQNSPVDLTTDVGHQFGHHRRFLKCSDKCRISEVFLFHPEWNNLHVFENAFWADNGSLGIFTAYEANQGVSQTQGSNCNIFHRRFQYSGNHKSSSRFAYLLDKEGFNLVRVQDKFGKVLGIPSSVFGVPRRSFEFEDAYHLSSQEQSSFNPQFMSRHFGQKVGVQEGFGRPGRPPEFCSPNAPSRSDAFISPDQLDEPVHGSQRKGQFNSCNCRFKGGITALPESEVFRNSGFLSSISSYSGGYDGRLRLWLEWCSFPFSGKGLLDSFGSFTLHQCERDESSSKFSQFLQRVFERPGFEATYRQYGDIILFKKDGFSSLPFVKRVIKGFSFTLHPRKHFFCPCPHPGVFECTCGPGVQEGSHSNGILLRSRLVRLDFPEIQILPIGNNRFFRYQGYYKVRFFCFSLPGSESRFSGCHGLRLESDLPSLHVSSSRLNASNYSQDRILRGGGNINCSNEQVSSLASQANQQSKAFPTSSRELFSVSGAGSGDFYSKKQVLEPVCVAPLNLSLHNQLFGSTSDISDDSLEEIQDSSQVNTDQFSVNIPVHFLDLSKLDRHINPDSSVPLYVDSSANELSNLSFQNESVTSLEDHPSPVIPSQSDPNPPFLAQVSAPDSPLNASFSSQDESGDDLIRNSEVGPVVSKDRLKVVFSHLRKQGHSPDSALLISSCHKVSSQRQYQSGWSKWLEFKTWQGILDADVDVVQVCNFLAHNFMVEGKALNTIKNYYYALRAPVAALYDLNLKDSEEIRCLFAGAFRKKPPRKGMVIFPKWSLSDLLFYLNESPFEPLETADWDHVFVKTLILIMLATGRRMTEIAVIVSDYSTVGSDTVKFKWFPDFLAKAQREDSDWVPEPPQISAIDSTDKSLCPVRAFHRYMEFRVPMGLSEFGGRLWPVGKISLSYLIIGTINDAIVQAHPEYLPSDLPPVGTHHLRKFVTSLSWKFLPANEAKLAKMVGSKSFNTLINSYIRDVPPVLLSVRLPTGTLHPTMCKLRTLPTT